MRGSIIKLAVHFMTAGHSVTICAPRSGQIDVAREEIIKVIQMLQVAYSVSYRKIALTSGAEARFAMIDRPYGAAMMHSPVLILLDADKADPKCVKEARHIACNFTDGKRPVIVEC